MQGEAAGFDNPAGGSGRGHPFGRIDQKERIQRHRHGADEGRPERSPEAIQRGVEIADLGDIAQSDPNQDHVLEMMKREGSLLGGETSGHIICLDRVTSGDGIVTALQVLVAAYHSGRSLNELKNGMSKYPQVLVNVRSRKDTDVLTLPAVCDAVRAAQAQLGDSGRVLLRPSGTEPLVRVMVEGRNRNQVESLAAELATSVETALADAVA